jgi:type II secretory pathway component PulF
MLRVYAKCLALFAALFCVSYGLRLLVVPDIVAIADREQATWRVEIAFVLDTLQNLGAGGAALTVVLAVGAMAWRLLQPPAPS